MKRRMTRTMTPAPVSSRRRTGARQAGFTLVELVLAISLVAAIATGMLMAMHNGLLTLDRIGTRLDQNRRALALDRLLRGQLDGTFQVLARCGGDLRSIFTGSPTRMRLVSTYSRAAGSRGYPVLVEYRILPNPDGTVRLVALEEPYSGFCIGQDEAASPTASAFVLADQLAYARFAYQDRDAQSGFGAKWDTGWTRFYLPAAVRVDMVAADPLASRIPQGPVTVPLHTSERPGEDYADHP